MAAFNRDLASYVAQGNVAAVGQLLGNANAAVQSVNGKAGVVSLTGDDIPATPASPPPTDRTFSPGHTPAWREDFSRRQTAWTSGTPGRVTDPIVGSLRRVTGGARLDDTHPCGFAAEFGPGNADGFGATFSNSYINPNLGSAGSITPALIGGWFWLDGDRAVFAGGGLDSALPLYVYDPGAGDTLLTSVGLGANNQLLLRSAAGDGTPVACPRRLWFYAGVLITPISGGVRLRVLVRRPGDPAAGVVVRDVDRACSQVALTLGHLSLSATRGCRGLMAGVGRYSLSAYAAANPRVPAEWLPPSDTPPVFRVDAASGDDAADGVVIPWRTADKVRLEDVRLGLLPSPLSPGGTALASVAGPGTVLEIDTTAAPMPIGPTQLTLATHGLRVRPPAGVAWIDFQAEEILDPTTWTVHSGSVYRTPYTGPVGVYVWDCRAGESPVAYTYVTSVGAVNGPGKQHTDGSHLYLWCYGSADPRSDGIRRVRSVKRGASPGSGEDAHAIALGGLDQRLDRARVAFTSACNADGSFGGITQYGIGTRVGFGGRVVIDSPDVRFGGNHCLGVVSAATNSDVTILDARGEQCVSSTNGGATVFVSYMDGGSGNTHRWVRPRCDATLLTPGDPDGATNNFSLVWLCHGAGDPFVSVTLADPQFTGLAEWQWPTAGVFIATGGTLAVSTYGPITLTGVTLRAAPQLVGSGSVTLVNCTNAY